MEENLISIIVPIYNVSKYLSRCMNTLLKQTYKNIEIIMVDDGSPDDCGERCDNYALEDSRIRVIHKKNEGLGMARNSGLEIAQGKYVMFIDSDDYVDVRMTERLYNRLQEQGADTCFCRYYNTTADGKSALAREIYEKDSYCEKEIKEVLLGMLGSKPEQPGDVEIGMSVWKGMYSMDIIRDHDICFQSERKYISEDIIFHIEYLTKCRHIAIETTPNYYYCDNGASLTKSYKANRFEMEKILLKKEIHELDQLFDREEYIQRLYKSFLGRVRRCIVQEVNANPQRNTVSANVRAICADPVVQEVIKNFDDQKLHIVKRLINDLIKHKCIWGIMLIFKIKK